ncbi:uncharacterized protein LOC144657905 [Oculina patagonica]
MSLTIPWYMMLFLKRCKARPRRLLTAVLVSSVVVVCIISRRTEYDPCKSVPQVSSLQENARSDSKTSTTQTSTSDLETNDETPFLSPAERLFKVYDEVETFVMFIGYPHSSHSLVGAILDAHPGIIIPHDHQN